MNDNFSLEEKSNQELWDNRILDHMKSWYDIDNFKKGVPRLMKFKPMKSEM